MTDTYLNGFCFARLFFFPGLGSYQTESDTIYWSNDPTIISGQNDTSIVVQPTSSGTYDYTFNIADNFGCSYDTVVQQCN